MRLPGGASLLEHLRRGDRLRWIAINGGFLAVVVFLGTHRPAALTYLFARDAHAYWAVDLSNPYAKALGTPDAYLYSPAFAQLVAPLGILPFSVFYALVTAANLAGLVYLLGPVRALLAVALVSPVAIDLWYGNIHLLMAVAIAVGFRYPGAWALLLLTKVTLGIGLLWFAARREWRPLAAAVGVTAAIATLSFLLAPGLWVSWIQSLLRSSGRPGHYGIFYDVPLWLRLSAAAALVTWGALTGRRWAVPVGSTLALPVLWFNGLAMLVAVMPFIDRVDSAGRGSMTDGGAERVRPP